MTILVDDRVGSRHYADLIPGAIVTRLESADIAFAGQGVTVGIEVKKLLDAVNCMYSGRLADTQIPTLRQQYDVAYLLVEGIWQPDPESGVLQYYKGDLGRWGKWFDATSGQKRLMYSSFEQWLTTLESQAGIRLRSSPCAATTAALCTSLYHWYQREDHGSLKVMQEVAGASADLTRPTMLRRMIALLPRVGWDRSGILAQRFHSVNEMVQAPPEAWLIERQIGMETAKKIVEALNGTSGT